MFLSAPHARAAAVVVFSRIRMSHETVVGRSGPDAEPDNNLDNLPGLSAGNVLTGGYDLVVQIRDDLLVHSLMAMHAARSTAHHATRTTDRTVTEITIGPHHVRLPGDGDQARARIRVTAWTHPLDDPTTITSYGSGTVDAAVVAAGLPALRGGPATVWTDWSATTAADVTLTAAPGDDPTTTAVLDWVRADGGGRFVIPEIAGIGPVTDAAVRFAGDTSGRRVLKFGPVANGGSIAKCCDDRIVLGARSVSFLC